MRYRVTLGKGQEFEVEIRPEGEPRVLVQGEPAALDLVPTGEGLYSLLLNGRSYELALARAPGTGEVRLLVDGTAVMLRIEDERTRALAALPAPRAHIGNIEIRAPMPGRIVAVHVTTGDAVTDGQALVSLEAMKMESSITAPHPATVREVQVRPGQAVQQQQILLLLDAGG